LWLGSHPYCRRQFIKVGERHSAIFYYYFFFFFFIVAPIFSAHHRQCPPAAGALPTPRFSRGEIVEHLRPPPRLIKSVFLFFKRDQSNTIAPCKGKNKKNEPLLKKKIHATACPCGLIFRSFFFINNAVGKNKRRKKTTEYLDHNGKRLHLMRYSLYSARLFEKLFQLTPLKFRLSEKF